MTAVYNYRNFLLGKLAARMASDKRTYEEAIQKLNKLQSNKATIDQIYKDIANGKVCTNLTEMKNYLSRTNIPLTKLDELSVIHVAGTKGKGSTSAMCESILRHHGFRTGFYSSPHLVAVRERIRLHGEVVSKNKFASNFHEVYDMLYQTQAYQGDMPKYFAFLTVLAFHMFLKEEVDVAVVEVGIGGTVDYTNILRKVPVVGITALGLDHTSILGHSLPEIASAKAGVIKRGCEAYTVRQPQDAMSVLYATAEKLQCPLYVVPEYETYKLPNGYKSCLPVDLPAYQVNASLAIQLAHAWMRSTGRNIHERKTTQEVVERKIIKQNGFSDIVQYRNAINGSFNRSIEGTNRFSKKDFNGVVENTNCQRNHHSESSFNVESQSNCKKINGYSKIESPLITKLTNNTVIGLKEVRWPGRYQIIETSKTKFYLDGAHTKESMEICAGWFSKTDAEYRDKALIFSATGDRDGKMLLSPLADIAFQKLFFVIPSTYREENEKYDNYYRNQESVVLDRCRDHARIWKTLSKNSSSSEIYIFECVSDALNIINDCENISVLVTGSLHLVGAALAVLDPNLSKD